MKFLEKHSEYVSSFLRSAIVCQVMVIRVEKDNFSLVLFLQFTICEITLTILVQQAGRFQI